MTSDAVGTGPAGGGALADGASEGTPAGPPSGCRSVVVVGLGVMGGSVAKAVRARAPELPVYGVDSDDATVRSAARDGVRPAPGLAARDTESAVVVFATPLDATTSLLRAEAQSWRSALLATDVAGLKAPVLQAAAAAGPTAKRAETVFAGSHPMCGSERSGYGASRGDLFEGARVWLCPLPGGKAALDRAAAFWRWLGGVPETVTAERHDRTMAWASHLPQLTAWALAQALDDAGLAPGDLGPGGADMTRLAASSPKTWAPLLAAAAREDAEALRALEARLADLRKTLERLGSADAASASGPAALARAVGTAREWPARRR